MGFSSIKYKKLTDLTNEEIKFAVNDIIVFLRICEDKNLPYRLEF